MSGEEEEELQDEEGVEDEEGEEVEEHELTEAQAEQMEQMAALARQFGLPFGRGPQLAAGVCGVPCSRRLRAFARPPHKGLRRLVASF